MNGGGFSSNLPILDGKNWDRWYASMRSLLGSHEVFEIVQDGYEQLRANPTERQQTTFKDCKKKDCKALLYIQQSVDSNNFERISKASTSKEVVVNQMRKNGESSTEVVIIEKILRTLTQRYYHIVVAIEESKDLDKMKVEDLQGSLEAHELRVRERCATTSTSQVQALQAQVSKKISQGDMKHKKDKGKFMWYKKYDSDEETDDSDEWVGSSRNQNRSDNSSKNSNDKNKFNKKGTQCYNCKKWGHFANECKSKKDQKKDDEAQMAVEDSDSDDVMKNNLLSLGQLLEKGYSMKMKHGEIKMFDSANRFVLKAPLSRNQTFKTTLSTESSRMMEVEGLDEMLNPSEGDVSTPTVQPRTTCKTIT
ncbi:uncharacterized protein [Cicer arietinum]|uniref:uncharacterized protein n=1 Tax=Cicer arietinum TaxID=3827 RepID=UPI003CC5A5FE